MTGRIGSSRLDAAKWVFPFCSLFITWLPTIRPILWSVISCFIQLLKLSDEGFRLLARSRFNAMPMCSRLQMCVGPDYLVSESLLACQYLCAIAESDEFGAGRSPRLGLHTTPARERANLMDKESVGRG